MNIDISGSQLELMLEKNEAKAQELTLTWIDKWNRSNTNLTLDQTSTQLNVTFNKTLLKSPIIEI